jgi:two-component system sensor histidine kinase CpxA
MSPRFPLSAKILGWFFLNLAVLVVLFVLIEFHFDPDWVFATSAKERVDTFRNLLAGELNSTSPEEWDRVIDRFGDAYHVRVALFDDAARHLIGGFDDLPESVRARLRSSSSDAQLRALMRTADPVRYWLLVGAWIDNPQAGGLMRVNLVAQDKTSAMGGLIIDLNRWLEVAAAAGALSILFWLPLLRGMTRSIRQMMQATQEIAEGRFEARVKTRRRDELGALGDAINRMAARLDGLVHGQKRFLGDVAHELCSPLARLQLTLGIIEQRSDERQKGYVLAASEKADEIAELVNQLLAFSRASFGAAAVRLEPVNVLEAIGEAVGREKTPEAEIQVSASPSLAVLADSGLLVRSLANLLRNALRHGPPRGLVSIRAFEDDGRLAIVISDEGPGVPEEELARIFDPFYRVDASRTRETGGMGLGLAIVQTCVNSCGGSVSASNRYPHGLEVTLHLQLADSNQERGD